MPPETDPSTGCGFTTRRVCVFRPSRIARTIADEKMMGFSLTVREKQQVWRSKSAEGGKKGAEKRWKNKSKKTSQIGVVTPPDNQTDEGGIALQSSSSSSSSKEPPQRAGAPKSKAEVLAEAERFVPTSTVRSKPDPGFVDWWWDEGEKCGWVDPRNGNAWANWRAAFTAAWRAHCHRNLERDNRRGSRPPQSGKAQPQHTPGDDKL